MSRHLSGTDRVNRVVVVGGTHGNERNGVFLARWLKEVQGSRNDNFELSILEGNTPACDKNVRYVEEDLNRQFLLSKLSDPSLKSMEAIRAKQIDELLGPKSSPNPTTDLIIDLHGTTSPCAVALMMHPTDEFSRELGGYLSSESDQVEIVNWKNAEVHMLPSVSRSGFTFEVGPVACGIVCPKLYNLTKELLLKSLDYINSHNSWIDDGMKSEKSSSEITIFQNTGRFVHYPLAANGSLNGFLHESMFDFKSKIVKGVPILQTFSGDIINWEEEDQEDVELFPVFVNEAAFYETNVAFYVVQKLAGKTNFLKN